MPPVLVTPVPYGRPAAEALRVAVADAKGGDPLAPVTVVVPSNHVGVTVRRLLASGVLGPITERGVGVAGVSFLTTYRLAELLGASELAGTGRRPVSTPVVTAAVRQVLADDPGLFRAVADHPATEAALVATYRELRDLPDAALGLLAGTGRRAADVVRVHRATRRALVDRWSDEQDLMAAATARVDAAAVAEIGPIVVHLPQVLPLHAAALLRALAARTPVQVLAGTTGDPRADHDVAVSLARLGVEVPTPLAPAPLPVAVDRTAIATASDADDEVRHAVRQVVAAARRGVALDRIAVLHPTPDPYARLLHEHLAAAGIARNGTSPTPLAGRAAGRALLGLMALPDLGWSRHAVLSWLGTAPLRHDGRPVAVTSWERLSREAGVVGGRADWDDRLADAAAARDDRATGREADGDHDGAARDRRRAERLRALRRFVLGRIDDLAAAAAEPRPWGEHVRWLRRQLDDLLGSAHQRSRWDDADEVRAAERVEQAIDRLGSLDLVEGPVGLDVALRTLAVELEVDGGRVGRLGDGVLVAPLAMGVGLDLDVVVVVGLAEGTAPTPPRDDSLLPDHERRVVDGLLPLRRDGVARQHRELLAALAAAGRQQVLTHPRGDLRGSRERVPSRWLLDIATSLDGADRWWAADLAGTERPWLHHVRSFDHGIRTLEVPSTGQEHRLRALLAAGAGPRTLAPVRGLGDPVLALGAELVAARSSPRLTRFDGNLAGIGVASPADPDSGRVASATGLERWARCPFDYFLQSVLGVREVDDPEDAPTISPADRGSLIHRVLELFVAEVLARPAAQRPGPSERWSTDDRRRVRELAEEEFARYEALGRTGRTLFWNRERSRILADLEATLSFEEGVRQVEGGRHLRAELGFGIPGSDHAAVALPLPDGREVRFRGQVDRIDRTSTGLLVADYKTGSDRDFTSLSAHDPDQGGTRLQLAVYGAAARAVEGTPDTPVRAEYWFISPRAGYTRRGYELTPEVEDRISETLALVVEGIEAGAFPPHPTDASTSFYNPCWSCDPDFLGVADLRRSWLSKADDPAMAGYLHLISPDRRGPDPEAGDDA